MNAQVSLLLLFALTPLAGVTPAWGAPRTRAVDLLSDAEVATRITTERVEELERQVAPGRAFITERQALERFEEAVYLHLLGEYEGSAERFFTLVTTAALTDAGYHRDAEWYLAESLFMMGNITTAEARYLVIAGDDQHPFRDEAVRRLLELYATTGQTAEFKAYYEQEILNGRVRPSDVITYSLAKSFTFQGEVEKGRAHFEQLGPASPFYAKARYFLGALEVDAGRLDTALPYFREIIGLPTKSLDRNTLEGRQVYDLSLLALARVHFERDDLSEAADHYGQIDPSSEFYADQLQEIIWTWIKQARREDAALKGLTDPEEIRAAEGRRQARFQSALDGVEIFLLRFPEHEYTAELQLLEAHLRMEQRQWDTALSSYEQVVADYTPISQHFGRLAAEGGEHRSTFQLLLNPGEAPAEEGLPAYAVAMMLSDDGLSRALTIYRELEEQEEQIRASEELIAELRGVLDSAAGIGGFERLRYEIAVGQGAAMDGWVDTLGIEAHWLSEALGSDRRREVDALSRELGKLGERVDALGDDFGNDAARVARRAHFSELESLRGQLAGLTADETAVRERIAAGLAPVDERKAREELTGIEADRDAVRTRLETLREAGPGRAWETTQQGTEARVAGEIRDLQVRFRALRPTRDNDLATRLDTLYTTVETDLSRLATLRTRLGDMEASEVGRIRDRFDHEVDEVGQQRVTLGETLVEAEDVSLALTRAGFGRLEDFFAESVLRADMGVVDVYWAQKLDVADQHKRMAEEKAALERVVETRFELIRQRLGP